MSTDQKKALFENTARAVGDAPKEIKLRHVGNCLKADPAYGEGVAVAMGIPPSELPHKSPGPRWASVKRAPRRCLQAPTHDPVLS
jgi:hypothetical protein